MAIISHSSLMTLVILIKLASGFYVPGVAPTDFRKGDKITVKSIKMTSSKTQLPYEYYSLPFCLPKVSTTFDLNHKKVYDFSYSTRTLFYF